MSSFFNKKVVIWTIVVLFLFSVIGFTFGGRTQITFLEDTTGKTLTPITKFLYVGGNYIGGFFKPITKYWKLDDENQLLREENIKLQNEIIQLKLDLREYDDIDNLKEALNYTEIAGVQNYISCNVIGKTPGNWFRIFTIDAGTKQGIEKNSAVLNGQGLIGQVYEVGSDWSKIITIVDNRTRISFEVLSEEQSYIGIVNGTNESLSGYLFDNEADIQEGDIIVTSGLGIYPKGIKIGTIKSIDLKKDELLKSIEVEPDVNFNNLSKVMVVPVTKESGLGD